jgi:exopolysaccharide biosynthesis polyprenyl glycosylphosphotransferase
MVRRLHIYDLYLRLACYLSPPLAFALAWYGLQPLAVIARWTRPGILELLNLLLLIMLVWVAVAEHYKLIHAEELLAGRRLLRQTVLAVTVTYVIISAALWFYPPFQFSRLFLVASALLLATISAVLRSLFRKFVFARPVAGRPLRILVVGADSFARQAVQRLIASASFCEVVGYVRLPNQTTASLNAPVYELDSLGALAQANHIDDVLVAVSPSELGQRPAVMNALSSVSAPVRAIVGLGEGVLARERLFRLGQLYVLNLNTGGSETLKYILLKRVFDLVFSLFAICITSPLMAIIALIVRVTSPGPVLFVQERVGLNGRIFRMYKFRTMKVSSAHESDTRWTTPSDPRRTRFGAFLRRFSLDELPQFFNVLKGDMSVVGPRPERPFFVSKFFAEIARYNTRHQFKVGITGWAQVNGLRGDTSIRRRLEYDLHYMQNWSLGFDLRIICRTLWSGLFGSNAY